MKLHNIFFLSFISAAATFTMQSNAEENSTPRYSASMIKVDAESEVDSLLEHGAQILRRRGDILLCLIPDSDSRAPGRRGIPDRGFARKRPGTPPTPKLTTPTLDIATEYFNASDIQQGNGFEMPYTGKGVVVGICDIGIDPLHPAFLDENGKSRIRRITQYIEEEGIRLELEGDEEYAAWETDTRDNYHATHVCGILAGNGGGSTYKGIARGADIVVSTSTLTDVGLLAGVEDIIDYAREAGKPAVINLSMGNYLGAHDGTSLFSQYLDMCADDAVIVLSAGNEGNKTIHLAHRFTEKAPSASFNLGNSKWNQKNMYGMTDIWSGDDTPLTIEISVYDDDTKKRVYSYDPVTLSDYDSTSYIWSCEEGDHDWGLTGFLTVCGGVNPENGRYDVALIYEYDSTTLTSGGWARYLISVKVSGETGADMEVFADGTYTRLMGISGEPKPTSAMSISDLACGERVISVGMYGNRADYPVDAIDGTGGAVELRSTGYEPGRIAVHSSYGTLRDGRKMPMTVAPGATLISAGSRPYLAAHPEHESLTIEGAPWISEGGTSMSSPYVAGYIATWLEALPTLTAEDVMRLIEDCNVTDLPDDDPRNGCGWFDPAACLRKGIEESGVDMISHPESVLKPDDDVTVFTMDGRKAMEGKARSLPALPKGIYIVKTRWGCFKRVCGGDL